MALESIFRSRDEAGKLLGQALVNLEKFPDPQLVALPGGGVPIAGAASAITNWPVSVLIARKLRSPWNPELAIGATTATGPAYFNKFFVVQGNEAGIEKEVQVQRQECSRREQIFQDYLFSNQKREITPILVDDGIATGATMIAAIRHLKFLGCHKIVCAVPVCAPEVADAIEAEGVKLICLLKPEIMLSVGSWYRSFPHIDEKNALQILNNQKIFLKNPPANVACQKAGNINCRNDTEESNP